MELDDDRKEKAIQKANERWNKVHSHYDRSQIKYDDWLELFERAIENCPTPIIDLGCGSGNDTLYLIERTECFDMTKGLPFEDNFTDIIISDLSLHYFAEKKTFEILEEIKRVLKPNGILLFRVNSVRDVNHGAGEGTEIEPHLYETEDGRYKRFFDNEDFKKFFANWEELYLHEETMGRYELEKVLWRGAFKVNK